MASKSDLIGFRVLTAARVSVLGCDLSHTVCDKSDLIGFRVLTAARAVSPLSRLAISDLRCWTR